MTIHYRDLGHGSDTLLGCWKRKASLQAGRTHNTSRAQGGNKEQQQECKNQRSSHHCRPWHPNYQETMILFLEPCSLLAFQLLHMFCDEFSASRLTLTDIDASTKKYSSHRSNCPLTQQGSLSGSLVKHIFLLLL